MNIKALKGDMGTVVGHYAASGDSITSQEAREVVQAARGGQLLGVFDRGKVVGLVAVDPSTGDILGETALPGVDISDPVDRVVSHYASSQAVAGSQNYRAQRPSDDYRQRRPHTQRPVGGQGVYDTEDMGYEGYSDLAYDDTPAQGDDGGWNREAMEGSDFISGWGADEETGVTDPSSSGQIKWPGDSSPSPEPISTMTTNSAVMTYGSQPTKKRGHAGAIIACILLLALVGGGVALYLTGAWRPIAEAVGLLGGDKGDGDGSDVDAPKSDDPIAVSIPDGYGSAQIGELLEEAGVIDDLGEFHKEVVRQGAESRLKSGSYILRQTMSMTEIVELLVEGPNDLSSRLTVPEGLSVDKTATLVETNFGIPASEFKEQAKASDYVSDYPFLEGVSDDSLEGFLFPKTYDFSGQTPDADAIIRKMLDQFAEEVDLDAIDGCKEEINARYNLSLSRYDVIKMASVIEREATNDDDRPLVASVFYNRLRDDMALQSDATLAYVLDHETTADDLRDNDSPYNTYKNRGLPPTPLCSPSVESLEAAKHPADTGYYYFFIVERDGYSNHSFSESYDQHLEVIATAQREMSEQGLSATEAEVAEAEASVG